jgi:hypothetical protein
MAVTQILTTDTLEQMRVKINTLAQNDFGDPALLGPAGIAATSVVGAVIELSAAILSAAGFGIEDVTSSFQQVLPGERLRVLGTSNQINAVVSNPDTLTFSLNPDITISGNFTTTSGNITAGGSLHTLGTVEISGNTIRSTDSSRININDTFRANEFETITGAMIVDEFTGFPRIRSTRGDKFFIFDATPTFNSSIVFEGATADAFETTIFATDPTADRTITIPDETGTIVTTGSSGVVTSAMILNSTILTEDIANDQITEAKMADDAVGQDQLKSVVNLQILNSSAGVLKSLFGAGA